MSDTAADWKVDLSAVPREHLEKAYQKACGLITHLLTRERKRTDPNGELVDSPPPEYWENILLYELRRTEGSANETPPD